MAGDDSTEQAWTVVEDPLRTGASTALPEPPPATIGRYRVLARLGAGGMGVVYRAHDPELGRDVAVKTVHRALAGRSDAARERALREAQAMARLSHPNVIEVYDVGLDHDVLFIAMQLVDGPTLSSWKGRDWRETLDTYLAAGEALAAAHAEGLVHRDFKPANVMIDAGGVVKVLDFGLVRLAGDVSSGGDGEPSAGSALELDLTATGTVLGTPAYMAPETFVGRRVDARADEFSFCVALWEALHGERPYRGNTLPELRRAVTRGELVSPPRGPVPAAVQGVLRRGLRVDPDDRWEDMPRLLHALRRASAGRSARVVVVLGVIAATTAGAVWLGFPSDPACGDATAALGATWDEARASTTEAAILGSGRAHAASTWEHLQPRLDDWAQAWTTSYQAICRATHVHETQSPALLDVRMACLERARDRVDAFLEVLGEGSERSVRGAITAAAGLSPPQLCVQAEDARDDAGERSPEVEARVAEMRRRLEQAWARRHAGEYDTALQNVLAVLEVAREIGDAALLVDALLQESDVRRALADVDTAEQSLRDAFLAATGADDSLRATQAATGLLFVLGVELGRHEEGMQWYRHARAQLDRLSERKLEVEARLLSTLGAVQGEMGDLEASTASELLALELERQALGPDDVRLVPTLANATAALINERRHEEAMRLAEEAVAVSVANLGPDHPDVTTALGVLARAATAAGLRERAKQASQRALEITAANYGETHLFTARAMLALGGAHGDAAEHDRALQLYAGARAILIEQLGGDHLELADVHERSADSLRSLGRYAEAAAELRRTIEVAQRVVQPDHPEFPISLGRLAEVTRLAGDPEEAVALYQRALELQPPQPERPRKSRSALLLGLAESLHAAGRAVEADEAYAGAIEHARGTAGARTTVYLDAATGRATLLVERGRADEAMVLLGPIHAGLGSASTQEERRAAAGLVFGLAQVARATGDRERARTLAEDARVRFVAVPDEAKAAEVESWLAAR